MIFGWSPKILWFDILIGKHQWGPQSLTHPVLSQCLFVSLSQYCLQNLIVWREPYCELNVHQNFLSSIMGNISWITNLKSGIPSALFCTDKIRWLVVTSNMPSEWNNARTITNLMAVDVVNKSCKKLESLEPFQLFPDHVIREMQVKDGKVMFQI